MSYGLLSLALTLLWESAEGHGCRNTWTVNGHAVWRTRANGTFCFPHFVSKLILDVGAHVLTEFINHTREREVMVIAFEPQDRLFQMHPRVGGLMLVPAAVGVSGRTVLFNEVSGLGGGLSSLKSFTPAHMERVTGEGFHLRQVRVEVVSLEEVLKRVPASVVVQLIKVDAQGADLDVVLSAGAGLKRALRYQLEVQDLSPGHPWLLYHDQPVKSAVAAAMEAAGFLLERCWDNDVFVREENCIFARKDVFLPKMDGCFDTSIPLLASAADHYWGQAFQGPWRIVKSNRARLRELAYCRSYGIESSQQGCCMYAYLLAIGYMPRESFQYRNAGRIVLLGNQSYVAF